MATAASRAAVPVVQGTRMWAAKPWWFAIGTWPQSTPFRPLVFRLIIQTCLRIDGRGLRRIAASLAPEIDAGVTRVVMGLGGWVDLRLGQAEVISCVHNLYTRIIKVKRATALMKLLSQRHRRHGLSGEAGDHASNGLISTRPRLLRRQ
jgi:hypothetical protein